MTKREIMTKAVKMAKKMQGDWVARMSLALKAVWIIAKKKAERFETSLEYGRKYWIAKIIGTHPQYKMARMFLTENYTEDNQRIFKLEDGLYHGKFSNNPHYFVVENGIASRIEYDDALVMAEAI